MDARFLMLPALLALGLAAPAQAQAQAASFQNAAIDAVEPCSAAAVDANATGDGVVATCEKAIADLALVRKSTPPVSGDDRNIDAFLLASIETDLAAGYLLTDKRASQRVCDHVEKSWTAASLILQSVSPGPHLLAFARGRENTLRQLRECRQIFSPPPGALPLP